MNFLKHHENVLFLKSSKIKKFYRVSLAQKLNIIQPYKVRNINVITLYAFLNIC